MNAHPHVPETRPRRWLWQLSGRLYWRTFVLIVALLSVSLAAWFQSFRVQQNNQQIEQTARQITSLIDLTRIALVHSAPQYRNALLDELVRREDIYIYPRSPGDRWTALEGGKLARRLTASVGARLHEHLDFASSVNDQRGLWIGFRIASTRYWLLLDPSRMDEALGETWVVGGVLATLLALIGAAVIAGFVNRPLRDLSIATAYVREGDFSHQLDESSGTEEIREVNRGFNRMARALQEIEQERALMLAGISHDIRTPLARLRLEAELSVPDAQARHDIVADIEQADSIISKFMEYARSGSPVLQRVDLPELALRAQGDLGKAEDLVLHVRQGVRALALADELETRRVLSNLLENARRYGRTPGSERAEVEISFLRRTAEVAMEVRDHGPGVPPDQLPMLTRPFFRGDAARTAAKGTGLGLAIVDRTVARMRGRLELLNADDGGLLVRVWLPRDPDDLPHIEARPSTMR